MSFHRKSLFSFWLCCVILIFQQTKYRIHTNLMLFSSSCKHSQRSFSNAWHFFQNENVYPQKWSPYAITEPLNQWDTQHINMGDLNPLSKPWKAHRGCLFSSKHCLVSVPFSRESFSTFARRRRNTDKWAISDGDTHHQYYLSNFREARV